MPLVNDDTAQVKFGYGQDPVKQTQPNVTAPDVKSNVIDSEREDPANLLVHVSGYRWVVNGYFQILAEANAPQHFSLTQQEPYQQYVKVNDLMLMVDQPLSMNFDNDLQKNTLMGAARIPPFIKCNVGDVFVGDIGNGRIGLFSITNVTMNSMFSARVMLVNYKLMFIITEQIAEILEKRVEKHTWFKRDFLRFGQNPLLVEEEVNVLKRLEDHEQGLLDLFIQQFFKPRMNTFLLEIGTEATETTPPLTKVVYDPFVVYAISSITNVNDHAILSKVRTLNVDGGSLKLSRNLWTMLITGAFSSFPYLDKYMRVIGKQNFAHNPSLASVYWISEIDGVVYPSTRNPKNDLPIGSPGNPIFNEAPDALGDLILNNLLGGFVDEIDPELPVAEPPLYHPVNKDTTYVLSEWFYNKTQGQQSLLELLTLRVIDGEAFEPRDLLRICDDVSNWGPYERFYYLPLLLILVKIAKRKM